ncbi:MAG: hypothetical protein ACLGIF_11570 [Actinomycetes bacterium]
MAGVRRTTAGLTVPWEIASWSPRVHSLTSQALHGGRSLDGLLDDSDPWARRDRDELRAAFTAMADRMLAYLPGGSTHMAPVGDAVLEARRSLRDGDFDGTLRGLAAADGLRRRTGPGVGWQRSPEEALDDVLAEAAERVRDGRSTAVSNVWRSDRTAAAEVRAEATTSAEPLREDELELWERVEPAAARRVTRDVGGRRDWSHRRPERAVEQTPGRQVGRSL